MTNDELKAELDALLIEYPAKATKAELEALYAPYAPVKTAEPQDGELESPQDGGDATQAPEPDPDEPEPIGEERAPESRPVRLRVSSPGAGLNVRDAPGGRILCTVGDGEELEAAGDPVGGWQPVRLTAYVMAEFAEPADE